MNDQKTADAFAYSWNNLPAGSVYTKDQFEDWVLPILPGDFLGKSILELGCGNGSLLVHVASCQPASIIGVDMGSSIETARKNLLRTSFKKWTLIQTDLTEYQGGAFDIVYCIGVLHHLQDPKKGFDAVIRNTKNGGKFHCWVYAREGNFVIKYLVDPIRKISSRLPWWFTKYFVATPLVVPYFIYAKILAYLSPYMLFRKFPLYAYSLWIAKRSFAFFRHVAFDQLVTPQTAYISRQTIEKWLASSDRIDPSSAYIIFRNGNSWKFGGKVY